MSRKVTPYVSIIMAVYNGEAHLRDTVSSILNQTFKDFEYIIINDGSTDATANILTHVTDPRILVIHNKQNRGLPYSLNKGLLLAQGKYIARIDADDLAMPDRLAKQVAFLEQHPEIGIVGTGCVVVNETGEKMGVKLFPLNDLEIRWISLLTNPFLHPSVMIRRSVLCQHGLTYDITFQASQDYELWTRLLEYTCGANLEDALVVFRRSHRCISARHRRVQFRNQDIVILRTIRQQLPEFTISAEHVTQLRESFIGSIRPKCEFETQRVMLAGLYLDLLAAFARKHRDHPEIKTLKQRETWRIALLVFRLQFLSYWLETLKRAVRLYPGIVYPLIRYILKKYVWKRLRRFIRRHSNELRK